MHTRRQQEPSWSQEALLAVPTAEALRVGDGDPDGVDAQARTSCMDPARDFGYRVDGAENIRRLRHADPARFRRQQCLQIVKFQLQRVAVDVPEADHGALLLQRDPGADVGLVVTVGQDDFIARHDAGRQRPTKQKH